MEVKCKTNDTLELSQLVEFQGNLKERTDADFEKIAKSIKKHGFAFPFFVWKHDGINHVLDGHGRMGALKRMVAQGEHLPPLPVVYVNAKDQADAKELLLKLNSHYGQMTAESVRDFLGDLQIDFEDLALPEGVLDFSLEEKQKEIDKETKRTLQEQFLIPPFSVLDTRQGYWQDRKKKWKSIGIKSEEGRDNKMLSHLKEYASKVNGKENTLSEISIFDPVLCETMYTWFCMLGGKILDPFAGGSVRGIVASYKNMDYTGFDIRSEQIEANEKQKYICNGNQYQPAWILCDSAKMDEKLKSDDLFDFIFSCPPYADLEKYSDLKGDISNMNYDNFLTAYREIIKKAVSHLKENRFAVFVVGEVRNKKTGEYYNFVPDTIKAFEDCGMKYYNEIILVNVAGGKAYVAGKEAKQSRKIAKIHQNILAFVKGDVSTAAQKVHENILVFLKGNSKQANNDLGEFHADDCLLNDFEDITDDNI